MRIEIEIPKEFEEHFKQDKFKDSLERIMADIKYSLENGECLCTGRYEYETIRMLQKAFENSREAYDIDKAVDELEELKNKDVCDDLDCDVCPYTNKCGLGADQSDKLKLDKAIKIVKHGDVSDDACEWNCDMYGRWHTECHTLSDNDPLEYTYCPYCGKEIKVVE